MSNTASFDIAQLAVNDTYEFPVTHPVTGVPVGVTITVWGIYTDHFLSATREFYLGGGVGDPFQSPQVLGRLTKGWTGLEENGEPLEAEDHAADVYARYPVIARQVASNIRDIRNFFRKA